MSIPLVVIVDFIYALVVFFVALERWNLHRLMKKRYGQNWRKRKTSWTADGRRGRIGVEFEYSFGLTVVVALGVLAGILNLTAAESPHQHLKFWWDVWVAVAASLFYAAIVLPDIWWDEGV